MDLMGTLDFAILYFYSSFVQGDTKKRSSIKIE